MKESETPSKGRDTSWLCICGARHAIQIECCPNSRFKAVSLEDIEKSLEEYTNYCIEKVEFHRGDHVRNIFKFYETLRYKREELIEMIKKFKEEK